MRATSNRNRVESNPSEMANQTPDRREQKRQQKTNAMVTISRSSTVPFGRAAVIDRRRLLPALHAADTGSLGPNTAVRCPAAAAGKASPAARTIDTSAHGPSTTTNLRDSACEEASPNVAWAEVAEERAGLEDIHSHSHSSAARLAYMSAWAGMAVATAWP